MTTTDVAVLDTPNEVAPQALSEKEAKALDKKIRSASDRVGTATENLLGLLEQAAAGSIHEALGLPSWTAWFKDAVQIQVSDRFERKELVKMMSGKGMSQRAIAGSLGVSQKTVDRDLEGEEFDTDTVTGLDGSERSRNGATTEDEYIDAEVVDGEEDSPDDDTDDVPSTATVDDQKPTPAVELVEQFNDETANLWGAHTELVDIMREPKWGGARKRVAAANLNHIQEIITGLNAIVDDLMQA